MERLLLVKDVMARYNCSAPTARKRMREMFHTENPLTVLERSLTDWESARTQNPIDYKAKNKTHQRAVRSRLKCMAENAPIPYRK